MYVHCDIISPQNQNGGDYVVTGKKIKYYRELRGFTQLKLTQMAGISLSSLKKYEVGERIPKPAQLQKIASVLQISPSILNDVESDTVGEFAHLFISLAKTGHIQFHGTKDEDGKYNINNLSFSFGSPVLKHFLKEWADGKEIIDHLREEAKNSPDLIAKKLLLDRADEIEQALEFHIMDSQLLIK